MPTRLLREGILHSERVDQLDAASEVFYRRLMSKVDDHGLFDARPSMLRASLYPLRLNRVREADVSRWMAACQKAGLIVLYEADGKTYLKMLDTKWKTRSDPRFPLPTANNCKQLQTTVSLDGDVDGDVDGDGTRAPPRASQCPKSFDVTEDMAAWAAQQGLKADLIMRETEKFLDHYRSKGVTRKDWAASWRNWIRKAVEFGK